jgi:hypothetical protein
MILKIFFIDIQYIRSILHEKHNKLSLLEIVNNNPLFYEFMFYKFIFLLFIINVGTIYVVCPWSTFTSLITFMYIFFNKSCIIIAFDFIDYIEIS